MGKVVKTVLLVVVVVAAIVFVPQLVATFGAAFATAATATTAAALTTLGQITAALIIGGITLAAQMLLGPKPPKLNQSMSDRLNFSINAVAPRKIVFGLTAAGSDIRYQQKRSIGDDEDPDAMHLVWALASHKINALKAVYIEDNLSVNESGVEVGKFASGFGHRVVLEGTSSNAHSLFSGSLWNSTSTFTGCAYMEWRWTLDFEDEFPDGIPTRITSIVEGCPVFDPRMSTVAGGSGPMNPNDQSTWAYYNGTNEIGRNPALCLLTYLLGWKINGKACWGMHIPPSRIDFANFITYANICDESVSTSGGGTIKRYQCDGIFDTNMTHEAIISAICSAMGSTHMVDSCGSYQLVGGYDDTDGPILTFSQDDLLGPYEWVPCQPSRDFFNIARGNFASAEDLYVPKEWGTIEIDPLADGIPRTQVMDFAAVSRAETCQRIAKQKVLRNLYQGTFSCTFGPRAFGAQVGSLVHLSIPAEGWNNKLFRVIDQTESVDLVFTMILQEESPEIYAWDDSEEKPLPPNVTVGGYDPYETASVQGLNASVRQVTNSTGGVESYIDLTFTIPTLSATSMQIQSKESEGTVWNSEATAYSPRSGTFTFKAPVGGLLTDVRARYRMNSGAVGPWTTLSITAAAGGASNSVTGYLTDESVTFAADSEGNIQ